ncbi:SDR family NAD(P)-dependent oxidoreductase [Streptomyces cacaoi]
MTSRTTPTSGPDIAVVGIGCRFPQAEGPEAYWRNVVAGVETVSFFTREQAREAGAPAHLVDDPRYVPAQAQLPDTDLFDAPFFGINPKEADLLDPQQRQLLECAWETFEDGGNPPGTGRLAGPVAVFVGGYRNAYYDLAGAGAAGDPHHLFQRDIGNEADYLATRLAYVLDLKGPAVSVQTACSSSLVAVHLAVQALRAGECGAALAGGVTVRSGEGPGYLAPEGSIYSPDGHCRSFDAAAQGTVIAEGVGLVLLKRLSDALADGDTVRAVIKGSATGNDGAGRVGFTAPSTAGQAAIVEAALTSAGVHPDSVGYVEAHGSATPMGDRIEIDALTRAYRQAHWTGGRRPIGSVKATMGHAHAAAGIAGLIKAVLALRHRTIPPVPHFRTPHPAIDFDASPFRVPVAAEPWPSDGDAPRRAGVSSFGLGGTGAHLILEEAPRTPDPGAPPADGTEPRRWHPLTLSARSANALGAVRERLAGHLAAPGAPGLAETAHTLHRGRRHFAHRAVVVADTPAAARTALADDAGCATARLPGRDAGPVGTGGTGPAPPVAFLLPGLGDQHIGMAERLYATEPVFRRELDRCAELLGTRPGTRLLAGLYPERRPGTARPDPGGAPDGEPDLLRMLGRGRAGHDPDAEDGLPDTRFAQPAVFAVEYALARLWQDWGIVPDALIGYSIGEFTAACLAGVLTLEDALRLVSERARLIAGLPPGGMLAVPLAEAELTGRLADEPELSLAALNGPGLSVVGGPRPALEAFAARLREDGVVSRPVRTSHAFHTPMMEPVLEEFTSVVASCTLREPRLPYVSTVTGDWITPEQARDPAHWALHLHRPVRFADGAARLWGRPGRVFLEVGPGRTLGSLALQARPPEAAADVRVLASLPARHEPGPEDRFLMTTLGELWLAGAPVDWEAVHRHERPARIPLPVYPFERRRHWPEPPAGAAASAAAPARRTGDGNAAAPAERDGVRGRAPDGRAHAGAGDAPADRLDGWFTTPGWTALPPLPAVPAPSPAEPWLLLVDDCGVGGRLAAELRRRQVPVLTVACAPGAGDVPGADRAGGADGAGESAASGGADHLLDPDDRDGWVRLLREAADAGVTPRHIVHLWTVTEPPAAPGDPAGSGPVWRRGFVSLLRLAQAWGEAAQDAAPVRVTVVSSGMQAFQSGGASCPDKAAVLGMCRVWPMENPAVACRSVDLVLPAARNGSGDGRGDGGHGGDGGDGGDGRDARAGEPSPRESPAREASARRVLAECLAPDADAAPAVALRGSRRYALTHLPVALPPPGSASDAEVPALREGGVYLITGGLGGIGLALADRLAREFRARLVLVARTGLPPRSEWPVSASDGADGGTDGGPEPSGAQAPGGGAVPGPGPGGGAGSGPEDGGGGSGPEDGGTGNGAEHGGAGSGADEETVRRIRAVRALEEAGAEVLVVRADVTDPAQLADAVEQARKHFGGVDGAVHAAGVAGGGVIQFKDPSVAADVLAPKLAGARHLIEALRPLSPSFIALCSSTLGLTGAPGQADYCAASACLDALAAHDEEHGTGTVVSLDWDGWTGIGMAERAAASGHLPAGPSPAEPSPPDTGTTGSSGTTDRAPGTSAPAAPATSTPSVAGPVASAPPAPEGPSPAGAHPTGHPLLGDRLPSARPGCDVHEARYSAADTWLVDEHRMLGHPVVPGTGHLELVRAALALRRPTGDATPVEIADVTFHAPVVLGEHETRRVRTVLEWDGTPDGAEPPAATFHVLSAPESTGPWVRHSTGRVRESAGDGGVPEPGPGALDALLARMSPLPPPGATGPMGFGPRSRCLHRMWAGEGECLAELRLPDRFAADLGPLALHPALMDIAAAYPGIHLHETFRIPLAYGRLRLHAPLTARLFSHHRFSGPGAAGDERAGTGQTVTSEITLFDADGRLLARVEGFVLKDPGALADRLRSVRDGTAPDLTAYRGPGTEPAEPAEPAVPAGAPAATDPGRAEGSARTAASADGAGPDRPHPGVRRTGPPGPGAPAALADHLARGIDPDDGTSAFLRVLAAPRLSQVAVSPRGAVAPALSGTAAPALPAGGPRAGDAAEEPEAAGAAAGDPDAGPRHPRPSLSTAYVAPRDTTERRLAGLMAQLLGIEQVGVHDRFFDLGGHSLLALQLLARLRGDFGARLSMNEFFQSLTVADLARRLSAPDGGEAGGADAGGPVADGGAGTTSDTGSEGEAPWSTGP